MTVKIVSLKSGEYVVTELQEAVDDKQRRQAFVFNNPHTQGTPVSIAKENISSDYS